MRTIKFRAWEHGNQMMYFPSIANMGACEGNPAYTIMQFTGLTDKNGKDVFEGDIYAEDYFSNVNPRDHSDNTYFDSKPRIKVVKWGKDMFNLGRGEVIGNIYENPELLSQEKPNETV